MTTQFIYIKHNGLCNIAVLEECGRQFCVNADSLRLRIENMKKDGRDTSTENLALVELNRLERL